MSQKCFTGSQKVFHGKCQLEAWVIRHNLCHMIAKTETAVLFIIIYNWNEITRCKTKYIHYWMSSSVFIFKTFVNQKNFVGWFSLNSNALETITYSEWQYAYSFQWTTINFTFQIKIHLHRKSRKKKDGCIFPAHLTFANYKRSLSKIYYLLYFNFPYGSRS